jgi:hypothetical protein
MDGRLRLNVVEHDAVFVLVLDSGGNLARDDFLEKRFCHSRASVAAKPAKYTKRGSPFLEVIGTARKTCLECANRAGIFNLRRFGRNGAVATYRNNNWRFEPRTVRAAASSRMNTSASS